MCKTATGLFNEKDAECKKLEGDLKKKGKECLKKQTDVTAAWCNFEEALAKKCQAVSDFWTAFQYLKLRKSTELGYIQEVADMSCILSALVSRKPINLEVDQKCGIESSKVGKMSLPADTEVLRVLAPYNASCNTGQAFQVDKSDDVHIDLSSSSLFRQRAASMMESRTKEQLMRRSAGGALYYEIHADVACHSSQQAMCGFGHPNHDCPFYVHRADDTPSLHEHCDLRKRESGARIMAKVCQVTADSIHKVSTQLPLIGVPGGLKCYDESLSA